MANEALQNALRMVLAELQKADGKALTGAGKNVVEVNAEVEPAETHIAEGEECEACAAGTCTNPDHMDDSEMKEIAAGH